MKVGKDSHSPKLRPISQPPGLLDAFGVPLEHSHKARIAQPGHVQIVAFLEVAKSVFRLKLNNGMGVFVHPIKPADIQEISDLTVRNFLEAPSFARLDANARLAFIAVNSPERLKRQVEHSSTIFTVIVRHPVTNALMAYGILKRGIHRVTHAQVALGERLHVSPEYISVGLGHRLHELGEFIARNAGYTTYVVKASGDSAGFFKSMGFKPVLQITKNRGMADRGIPVPFSYLQKKLI